MTDALKTEHQELVLRTLEERFGIPRSAFSGLVLLAGSKGRVSLTTPEAATLAGKIQPKAVGLVVARIHKAVKPTTNVLQLVEQKITKSRVLLTEMQAADAMKGLDLTLTEAQQPQATDGYVSLFLGPVCLGCGLKKGASVKNMIPKGKRIGAGTE